MSLLIASGRGRSGRRLVGAVLRGQGLGLRLVLGLRVGLGLWLMWLLRLILRWLAGLKLGVGLGLGQGVRPRRLPGQSRLYRLSRQSGLALARRRLGRGKVRLRLRVLLRVERPLRL